MLCSACNTSALRCFLASTEAARIGGLSARNVRYSATENTRRLFQTRVSAPRNQPASILRISLSQRSQIPDLSAALSSVEDPRQGKELSHRDTNGSRRGFEYTDKIHQDIKTTAQRATIPVALRSLRDFMKVEGVLKLGPSTKNDIDQNLLETEVKSLKQLGDTTSRRKKRSPREEDPRVSRLAGSSRRARIQDYSSSPTKKNNGPMRSSSSPKALADPRTGTAFQKDQREPWQTQKKSLSEKFGSTGWLPRKRLSPDTLEGIRALHAQYPDKFTTPILADQFKVSPEAIRRILKSKWRPKDGEEEERRRRWERRGENIWSQMVEMGIKPPKKWREMGVGKTRYRHTAQSKQLESRIKSKSETSSRRAQPNTDLHTVTANRHESGPAVLLAERIL